MVMYGFGNYKDGFISFHFIDTISNVMFVAVETNIDWKIHINLIKVQHIVQKKEAQREPTIYTLYKSNQNYSSNHQHKKPN